MAAGPDEVGVLDAVDGAAVGPDAVVDGAVGHAGARAAHAAHAVRLRAHAADGAGRRPPSSCVAHWGLVRLDRHRRSLCTDIVE